MSDADDQMGGTGGQAGAPPGHASQPGASGQPAGGPPPDDGEDEVDEESEESFPASDPPANY